MSTTQSSCLLKSTNGNWNWLQKELGNGPANLIVSGWVQKYDAFISVVAIYSGLLIFVTSTFLDQCAHFTVCCQKPQRWNLWMTATSRITNSLKNTLGSWDPEMAASYSFACRRTSQLSSWNPSCRWGSLTSCCSTMLDWWKVKPN